MNAEGWGEFDAWHKLFDARCNRRGWYDNAHLAGELCARVGKSTQQDFDAAKKKLRTWRSGQRLPLRRNLAVLGHVLEVDRDAELERRWYELYRLAQAQGSAQAQPQDDPAARDARSYRPWLLGGLAFLLASGAAFATVASNRHAAMQNMPIVNFEGRVRVPVGASHLIHGYGGTCDAQPPAWEEIADDMPATALGTFEDGGLARKVVRACGKEKLVRAVRFTGLQAGSEGIRLFNDFIKLDVVLIR